MKLSPSLRESRLSLGLFYISICFHFSYLSLCPSSGPSACLRRFEDESLVHPCVGVSLLPPCEDHTGVWCVLRICFQKRVGSSVESQTLIQSRCSSARPSAGSPVYRCLEDTSKQVIIMRWALQKFTLVSSLSVTISSASKYSRESTSKACCSSTDDGTDREKMSHSFF